MNAFCSFKFEAREWVMGTIGYLDSKWGAATDIVRKKELARFLPGAPLHPAGDSSAASEFEEQNVESFEL